VENSVIVLVVEDDPLIHDVLGEALVDGGFRVAQASTGADAFAMLEAPDAAYRALVTDVNLIPGQATGWEIAKRAREINPDIPVIYMTGNSGHEYASNGVPNSIILGKPFAPAQLIAAVSQLLNQSQATPPVSGHQEDDPSRGH
jgi:DNA-binding response OmpR family regulator